MNFIIKVATSCVPLNVIFVFISICSSHLYNFSPSLNLCLFGKSAARGNKVMRSVKEIVNVS